MEKYFVPILKTERLISRAVTLNDAQDMYDYASKDEVVDFITFPKHESVEDSKDAINTFFLLDQTKLGLKRSQLF